MYNTVLFQGYTQLRYIATKLLPPKTTIFYWDPCSSQIFNSVCGGGGGGKVKNLGCVKKKGKKGTPPPLNVVLSLKTKGLILPGSFFFIFEKFFFGCAVISLSFWKDKTSPEKIQDSDLWRNQISIILPSKIIPMQ